MNTNPMLPYPGKLVEVRDLAAEIKLLRVELAEPGAETFKGWQPGQFAFVSAYGLGEAPFGIANMSQDGSLLDFAVARLGSVTTGLHELGEGDTVGVRGPLGNCFPMDKFKGKNLVVLGGGIGGAPLRPVIQTVLSQRLEFGSLTILWAARNQSLLVFTDEYDQWRAAPDTRLHLTIDQADPKWDHNVGLITEKGESITQECYHRHLWPTDHDLLCDQDAGRDGFYPGRQLCHPGGAHALRAGEMRSLQSGG